MNMFITKEKMPPTNKKVVGWFDFAVEDGFMVVWWDGTRWKNNATHFTPVPDKWFYVEGLE